MACHSEVWGQSRQGLRLRLKDIHFKAVTHGSGEGIKNQTVRAPECRGTLSGKTEVLPRTYRTGASRKRRGLLVVCFVVHLQPLDLWMWSSLDLHVGVRLSTIKQVSCRASARSGTSRAPVFCIAVFKLYVFVRFIVLIRLLWRRCWRHFSVVVHLLHNKNHHIIHLHRSPT